MGSMFSETTHIILMGQLSIDLIHRTNTEMRFVLKIYCNATALSADPELVY